MGSRLSGKSLTIPTLTFSRINYQDLRRPGLSDSYFGGRSTLAVNARNRAKTTEFKSDILETPVILVPEITATDADTGADFNDRN